MLPNNEFGTVLEPDPGRKPRPVVTSLPEVLLLEVLPKAFREVEASPIVAVPCPRPLVEDSILLVSILGSIKFGVGLTLNILLLDSVMSRFVEVSKTSLPF